MSRDELKRTVWESGSRKRDKTNDLLVSMHLLMIGIEGEPKESEENRGLGGK